ncbi:MAG TPA: S1C family serine protease [Massilibacterium sp.]|nr:S1C family serine protease [Massilibacterium sp.]
MSFDDYQTKKKSKVFFPSLIGAIIGALLVIVFLPFLSNAGLLSYSMTQQQKETVKTEKHEPAGLKKGVDLEVTTDVTKAFEKASPAVVGVVNIQKMSGIGLFSAEIGEAVEAGAGSGVIYKKDGDKAYIVTNNHVVEGASEIEVSLNDGTRIPAKLLGRDQWTDLAVLQVAAEKVKTAIEIGDSDSLKPGEPAIAIGNPLGKYSNSVTQGIISGIGRTVPVDLNGDGTPDWNADVLQTDAAINPGNSGGALINISGQLIGINSMKVAEQAVEGIGFSIPINSALTIIADLEKYGEVKRPFLGVTISSLTDVSSYHWQNTLKLPKDVQGGVIITSVSALSAADKAGLKEYDVIVQLDGNETNDVIELRKYIYEEKNIGDKVKVTYYRDGQKNTTELELVEEKRIR